MNTWRLKFRVWDYRHQKYFDNDIHAKYFLIDSCGCVRLMEYGEPSDRQSYYNPNDYEIELCTGLMDKHGALIYDGDVFTHNGKDRYTVKWEEGGYPLLMGDATLTR